MILRVRSSLCRARYREHERGQQSRHHELSVNADPLHRVMLPFNVKHRVRLLRLQRGRLRRSEGGSWWRHEKVAAAYAPSAECGEAPGASRHAAVCPLFLQVAGLANVVSRAIATGGST
jgi:hypothetical protein